MLKWHQWRVCFSIPHISLIISGSCYRSGTGTRAWLSILTTRHHILTNTNRPFRTMWRLNAAPNIDVCRSINSNADREAIASTMQWIHNPVNHPSIHRICSVMMENTQHLTMWLRRCLDKEITLRHYWPPSSSISIRHLNHLRTGGIIIQMSMFTTPTQWRSAVHFGYRT